MKKLLFLLVTVCTISVAQSQDKKPVFGLKAGLNLSLFSASVNLDVRTRNSFHIGAYMRNQISKRFFFRPELYYSTQGQKNTYIMPLGGPSLGETTTRLDYINAPLLFEVGNKVSFIFGPQLGVLLSATERGRIDGNSLDLNLKQSKRGTDIGLVLGAGFVASPRISGGVRINIGMTDTNSETRSFAGFEYPAEKNRVIHMYLGYSF